MNKTIIRILKTNIEGQLKGIDLGGGITIAGKPGIGKTATMKEIANDMNLVVFHVSIPEVVTEELSGIPDFKINVEMDQFHQNGIKNNKSTNWSVPQLIENVNTLALSDKFEGVLLFIDDLHRISMSVAPYLYGLLGEKKLGNFKLHNKVVIMGAMNDSDEAGFDGIDSPIKDRIGILPVEFDFEWWFQNHGRNLDLYTSSFLRTNPQFVQEDESTSIEQFGTPRSWTHLSNEIGLYSKDNDNNFLIENGKLIAMQKVSKAAATAFHKHIVYMNKINFKKILKERKDIKIKSLKVLDQILYGYIINYVNSFKDAQYIGRLLDINAEEANFVGFITAELYNKHISSETRNKPITKGIRLLINTLLQFPFDRTLYETKDNKLSDEDLKIGNDLVFQEGEKLIEIAANSIN